MPTKRISENIIGITKGVITILEILPFTRGERSLIKVKCKCGNIKIIEARDLAHRGHVQCSCNMAETKQYQLHPLYTVWGGMKARCVNPNHVGWPCYGARGIKVCDRWLNFLNFYEDVKSGYKKGLHLDRINNNGNYEPNNFQWITPAENNRKSRRAILNFEKAREIRVSTLSTKDLSNQYGVSKAQINFVKSGRSW